MKRNKTEYSGYALYDYDEVVLGKEICLTFKSTANYIFLIIIFIIIIQLEY